jgi:hypothetical protein
VTRRGRPPVLDKTKRTQVLAVVSVGCSLARAAEFVGCARSTIRDTARRDPEFAKELDKARCSAELSLVKSIRKAANKEQYWRAAAWALERGFPEKYGPREPDALTIEQVNALLLRFADYIVAEVPERDRKRILKQLTVIARSMGCQLSMEPADASRQ